MSQLPLELKLEPNARFDTFVPGDGSALLEHLRSLARGGRSETVWLAGAPDSGKTHLLQAACREAGEAGRRAIYLGAGQGLPVALLDGLGGLDLVAIDDVAGLAGDAAAETALFGVVNDFYRGTGVLLMAAGEVPAHAGFRLRDLASRASGATVYRLRPLSDEARGRALEQLANARGIDMDSATSAYLLSRIRRDMRAVTRWLDLIDRESLAASRRRITVPFVRDLLRRHGAESGPQPEGDE